MGRKGLSQWRFALPVLVLVLVAGCGGGGGGGGGGASGGLTGTAGSGGNSGGGLDGGAGDAGSTTTAGARAFCPGTLAPSPFLGLGDSCGAGSNYALCVLAETDCTTGLCLWDQADPVREQSYCTIACQPGAANACPTGFACRTESCESKSVCVRVAAPTTSSPGIDIHAGVFPYAALMFGLGMLGDKSYWLAGNGVVWEGTAGGTATQLTGSLAGGLRDAYSVIDGNSVLLWIDANDIYLARVTNGAFTTRMAGSFTGGIFKTQDGTVYLLETDSGFSTFIPVMPDLSRSTDTTRRIQVLSGLLPRVIYPLRDYGFVGYCEKDGATITACASADGRAIADLGDVQIDGALARQSYRPDHIWMPVPGGLDVVSELALWNGTAWIKEALMPSYEQLIGQLLYNPTVVGVVPLSRTDDRLFVFVGDDFDGAVAYVAGDCYTPLYAVGSTYLTPFDRSIRASLIQTAPDTIEWTADASDIAFLSTSAFAGAPRL